MEVLALSMKNNIKELRKARGLRQEDMAKLLGVSRQTIVAMENDARAGDKDRAAAWAAGGGNFLLRRSVNC